jgi:pyridoxine 5-phosphate synthase
MYHHTNKNYYKGFRMLLGVNIDHIAVLREARQVNDPSPLDALFVAKSAGADQITIHLREDRRHIHDDDAADIIRLSSLPVNLECSINPDIIAIVREFGPHRATLVPENRNEVTTEGGLDVAKNRARIADVIRELQGAGIAVSLFTDPDQTSMELSAALGAQMVELHTGRFANIYAMLHGNLGRTRYAIREFALPRSTLAALLEEEIGRLKEAAAVAHAHGLQVAAGHGLNYQNVTRMLEIPHLIELNIGQSIIARSVYTGLAEAIREMKRIIG